jgi:signal transduction histidine kinase
MQPPRAQIILPEKLGNVMAHEASLTQVLSNLLSNAVKFVNPQTIPQIDIRAEHRNGKVRLWITDNGIGIKPEFQSRLFRMFERINPGMRYEGTGIGLAIVKKAVERMGGTVGVESDGVTGTSFWIELSSASTRPAQTI